MELAPALVKFSPEAVRSSSLNFISEQVSSIELGASSLTVIQGLKPSREAGNGASESAWSS